MEYQPTPIERFVQFVEADFGGKRVEADRLAGEMVKFDGMPPNFIELRRKLANYRATLQTGSGWPKPSSGTCRFQRQIEGSLDVQTIARRTGKSARTIQRWIASRSLYAVWDGKSWRVPAFQFTNNGSEIIPGISEANQMLTEDLDPKVICDWFQEPNPELKIHGEPASPVQWLIAGRPPFSLAHQVVSLHIVG